MSDKPAGTMENEQPEPAIENLVETSRPIGDLRRFVIDDLSPDEEDAFFATLEDA